jgi:hypothetical protein
VGGPGDGCLHGGAFLVRKTFSTVNLPSYMCLLSSETTKRFRWRNCTHPHFAHDMYLIYMEIAAGNVLPSWTFLSSNSTPLHRDHNRKKLFYSHSYPYLVLTILCPASCDYWNLTLSEVKRDFLMAGALISPDIKHFAQRVTLQ